MGRELAALHLPRAFLVAPVQLSQLSWEVKLTYCMHQPPPTQGLMPMEGRTCLLGLHARPESPLAAGRLSKGHQAPGGAHPCRPFANHRGMGAEEMHHPSPTQPSFDLTW